MEDACFLACRLINDNPYSVNYGAVIVDETQDLSAPTLKLLALLATPKDQDNAEPNIFMVGDGHQRIYSRTANYQTPWREMSVSNRCRWTDWFWRQTARIWLLLLIEENVTRAG